MVGALMAGLLALCAPASVSTAQDAKQLRIVKQPGLGYLQLIVMREQKLLEKRLPGVEIEWRQLKSLKDIVPTDRIAMPAPGSIQHVALQMQADQQIVAMSHPDATAAIRSKREITCHLSSPPFQYEQLRDPAIHKVFDSYQAAGGPHTFNLVWASQKWVKANPRIARIFVDALTEATDFVNANPAEAARLYVASEKAKSTPEQILEIMKQDGIKYTMTPAGLMKFASFMQKIGMIKAAPASWRDYAFEHLHALPGS